MAAMTKPVVRKRDVKHNDDEDMTLESVPLHCRANAITRCAKEET
jgi:hypothetical protein